MFCRCNEKEEKGFKHLILIEKNLLSLGIISSSQIFWSLFCWQFYIFTAKIFISYNALYVNIAFSKDTEVNIILVFATPFSLSLIFSLLKGFTDIMKMEKNTQHKKWSFPLRISSVNVSKSAVSCGFGRIYRRNP